MGRAWQWFVKYMASYAVLMITSYVLWLASGLCYGASAGAVGADVLLSFSCGLRATSDFLVLFAVFAYPAYAAIKAVIGFLVRRGGVWLGASQRKAKGQML